MFYVITNMKYIVIHYNIDIGGLSNIHRIMELRGLLGEVLEGL